jgi:peptidoglycan DL-endopeptidase CwlO
VDENTGGRHRQTARYNPVAELSVIARAAGETGARASAVLAASGGLVAAVTLPATSTAPQSARSSTALAAVTVPASLGGAAASGPAALPAAPSVAAPALVAPSAAAPLPVLDVGVDGVRAVAKPRPRPVVATPVTPSSSRGASTPTSADTPAPVREVPSSATGVVDIARTLLGIPYRYGGESPSTGFDCSGFTQYVFRKAGTSIPRTASAQQDAATPVSDPKPGDLVFFGSPAWHVGIYTGNGMMIDSPRKGKSTSERPIFDGVSGYGRF